MGIVNAIIEFLGKVFTWWFTVMPWEQAIRVRRGKRVKLLSAGFYLRIPFVDAVYVQTTRMRMCDTPMQTVSTKDGLTVTIKSAVGYVIADIQKLFTTLYHPEMTINSMVMGFIGEFVRGENHAEITPIKIEEHVNEKINAEQYGLKEMTVKITTFAAVKTFRLIQDGSYLNENLNLENKKQ